MNKKRYIKSIRLYRFQSHVDTTFTFDKGINAILGETDSGKSAITRALYWCLYNKPSSITKADLITHGTTHGFVTITLSDGMAITRGRKKDENYYLVKYPDGSQKEFKGFGMSIPKEIVDAHGMHLLPLDDNNAVSLNVSRQLDNIFLLEDSASQRAAVLGKLTGAEVSDGAGLIVGSWSKEVKDDNKRQLARVAAINEEVADFSYMSDLEQAITELTTLSKNMHMGEEQVNILTSKLQEYSYVMQEKQKLTLIFACEAGIITLDELCNKLAISTINCNALANIFSSYKNTVATEANLNTILNSTEQVNTADTLLQELAIKTELYTILSAVQKEYVATEKLILLNTLALKSAASLDEATTISEHISDLAKAITNLTQLIYKHTAVYKELENLDIKEQELKTEEAHILHSLSALDKCDTCGQIICMEELHA